MKIVANATARSPAGAGRAADLAARRSRRSGSRSRFSGVRLLEARRVRVSAIELICVAFGDLEAEQELLALLAEVLDRQVAQIELGELRRAAAPAVVGSAKRTRMSVPPRKSTPKLKPRVKKSTIASRFRTIDRMRKRCRLPTKSMFEVGRDQLHGNGATAPERGGCAVRRSRPCVRNGVSVCGSAIRYPNLLPCNIVAPRANNQALACRERDVTSRGDPRATSRA